MNNYRVAKYFDDHLERWIGEPTTESEAKRKASELNDKSQGCYVRFIARPITQNKNDES